MTTSNTTEITQVSGWVWIAGFGIFTFLMVTAADSPKYGEIAVAFTWLVALGSTFVLWDQLDEEIANLLGAPTPTDLPNTANGQPAQGTG
jgi:hypothetical protein